MLTGASVRTAGVWFRLPREVALESAAFHTGFGKLLRGSAGGGESLHAVTGARCGFADDGEGCGLAGAGASFESGDLIAAGEDIFHGGLLLLVEVTGFDLAGSADGGEGGEVVPAGFEHREV